MNPLRPYLLKAYYQWFLDNEWTPHLVVNATFPDVVVPNSYASEENLVLNIHPDAVAALLIDQKQLSFLTRFNGISHKILVPMPAVLGLFSPDTEAFFMPDPEPAYELTSSGDSAFTLVKNEEEVTVQKKPPASSSPFHIIK